MWPYVAFNALMVPIALGNGFRNNWRQMSGADSEPDQLPEVNNPSPSPYGEIFCDRLKKVGK